MRYLGWFARAAGGIGALCVAQAAHAEPIDVGYGGQDYQDTMVDTSRVENRLQFDPNPEGKKIERIVAAPHDVVTKEDLYPLFINWFHITTLPYVVTRELLFGVGDPYSAKKAREAMHNIRVHLYVSAAQIVACKGSTPDQVVVLVVTKDQWSLRPNSDFLVADGRLQRLYMELTEENLLGRMKRASVNLGLDLFTQHLGAGYVDPRLGGSIISMAGNASAIWNRWSGLLEGGTFNFAFQQPLYTLDTPWAWIASVQYQKDIYRLFSGGDLAKYRSPVTGERVPYQYNRHQLDVQAGLTRSYGHDYKWDYSFGYKAYIRMQDLPAQVPAIQAATQRDFESSVLPYSESVGMLYASVHGYEGAYKQLVDRDSFAVTEEYRLGMDWSAELRAASPVFGFSSSYFAPVLNATWRTLYGDNLFTVGSALSVRYQPQLPSESAWANGAASISARNISPRFSIFRLHNYAAIGRRFNDYNHTVVTLGGDSNLRGYPVSYLVGTNYAVSNVELRTLPLSYERVYVGLASFFDIGAASTDWTTITPYSSVGGGLRIGFPQFNQAVLRLDFGLPLQALNYGETPSYFVAQYGQAF